MIKPVRTIEVVPKLPAELEPLREIAFNLRWAWDHDTIELFRRLDRGLWETSEHNPVRMLGTIPQERLNALAANASFRAELARIAERLDEYLHQTEQAWFLAKHSQAQNLLVVYFSMEFGLTDCIPTYSGGLGMLAGDHLKSASDQGIPLVGIGLAYQQGYFRQYLNADGWQGETYPINDFYTMPMQLERDAAGNPLLVSIPFPGREIKAQIWRVQVGRVPLYLLDTNIPANAPADRDITDQLYGGDTEMRIKQEMVLGIGGVRALRALGLSPTVFHVNEGHAAFSALERIRQLMEEHQVPFEVARWVAMAGSIFTTHTPVPAGIDQFSVELIDKYLTPYYEWLKITREEFLALGRVNPNNWQEPFNMAVLAFHLSAFRNGVSKLHGAVSRRMWQSLWPGLPEDEIPITSITNGMHVPSWTSFDMAELYDRYLGPAWRTDQANGDLWKAVEQIPLEELWRTHERRRERLVAVARRHLQAQLQRRGALQSEIDEAGEALNPGALTIGFARRFATYKRAALLLKDPERLKRILLNPERPVQIIFAGKAHPADGPGKEIIRQIVHFARQEEVRRHVVFLEDYDANLARYLVAGADVWLNTPRRPREASGTSGMKAVANGVLHVSTLDGWWNEAYSKDVGWAIGQGEVYADEDYQDQVEAEALYDLLEKEIIPLFYERGPDGVPRRWAERMRRAIAQLVPIYNTNRMVREYTERMYLPAHDRFSRLSADNMARARALASWLGKVRKGWTQVGIRSIEASREPDRISVGEQFDVQANIFLGELAPEDVVVELYFGRLDPDRGIIEPQVLQMEHAGADGDRVHTFQGTVACTQSGRFGYTVRVRPIHPDLPDPILPGMIIWAV